MPRALLLATCFLELYPEYLRRHGNPNTFYLQLQTLLGYRQYLQVTSETKDTIDCQGFYDADTLGSSHKRNELGSVALRVLGYTTNHIRRLFKGRGVFLGSIAFQFQWSDDGNVGVESLALSPYPCLMFVPPNGTRRQARYLTRRRDGRWPCLTFTY